MSENQHLSADIVERLRKNPNIQRSMQLLCREAADEIERLRHDLVALDVFDVAQSVAVSEARERVLAAIADLQGEHEVMAGPFDPTKWKIDISVSDLQALASQPSPAATVEKKSAPGLGPSQNNAERLPSSDAAGSGAAGAHLSAESTKSEIRKALDNIGKNAVSPELRAVLTSTEPQEAQVTSAGATSDVLDEPVAWLVTWTTKNNGPTASAYIRERDARDAARNVEKYADASNVVVAPTYAATEPQAAPVPPKALHWLGDREDADRTRHAVDMTGCVLYFEQQSDCLQFMRWLETSSQVSRPQCPNKGDGALGLSDDDAFAIQEANAAFIVKAVNNHDALVQVLKHSYASFERLAAEFDKSGDSVNFALCSRDASMTADVLAAVSAVGDSK